MKINSAKFVVSNQDVKKCPSNHFPEYAFIGRSNVGKSSLINMLTNHKNLAKTSGKPGKTQLINHFLINNEWYLVDLPGYGYARVSKTQKAKFQKFITRYFEQRKQLICGFVLVDIRHDPQPIDTEFMEWLGSNGVPFAIVFTKADKLKPKAIEKQVNDYKEALLQTTWEEMPPYFITSASKGIGKEELLGYIDEINKSL
ncbi:GTP-binding protein EngB [Nonlabens tegetincola]|uniref:Probable GTP-binding protein EngB n=1 Tax=Nonlabens tegetincola TaxID=323273 RepID=A0A090Q740_9FLAO|nr:MULTISPECIES: ribosome biogenesis GTP-binding protein YihA/YsxC [Nonlabens]MEE2802512.1 ribosome biogenesis GTP-binding protein YihA/YsxC [Bacteroidota bacterium]ALM20624.1 GTP-binding protein [Nonlabens sp. MIC269]ARN70323.1 YihA family ribosome biogenesis GTP-binding protein [Nonlabens tegetincola]PQJ19185.1 YihA family ribosome biogenesis GTP-binding protein [Nonlabens tegetincola]GAK97982.1 GTP-binding protein EngB [Nonlabens tegetincola]